MTQFASLSRTKDFETLRAQGQSIHVTSWLLVNIQLVSANKSADISANEPDAAILRCGWTIPRQIGPAVIRNRFRRWGREYLRKWCAKQEKSLDLNLVFKRKEKAFYKSLNHKEFDEALEKMVGKIERFIK